MPKIYPTDLNDAERAILAPLLEPPTRRGRPRRHELAGGAERDPVRAARRRRLAPPAAGFSAVGGGVRSAAPLARKRPVAADQCRLARPGAAPGSQAGAAARGDHRQPDGQDQRGRGRARLRRRQADQRPGRKRHLVVDTQGLLLRVRVHAADLHDRRAAEVVLDGLGRVCPEVRRLFADMAYQGLGGWARNRLGWELVIVKRRPKWVWVPVDAPPPTFPGGFEKLPKRWIVEPTFAWLGRNRRLAKDWERLCATGETWIHLAMSRLMAKRLAKAGA